MSLVLIDAESIVPQAWRNGGGQTHQLMAWPQNGEWAFRISRADIDADGPFSAFPGVERWFAVLHGKGVVLSFADSSRELTAGDPPLRFDGGAALMCRLVDGPTRDLNLMLRRGVAKMCRARADTDWREPFAQRGLYTTAAGRWSDGAQTRSLAAGSLLWAAAGGQSTWHFAPDDDEGEGIAYWIGFTPAASDSA